MPDRSTLVKVLNAIGSVINPATSDNQTNGLQKTQPSWSTALDAFGRQRFSQPHTVLDITNKYEADTLFSQSILAGGGTVTHLPNESSLALSVGTTSGDKATRQSRSYLHYDPLKSQLIVMSRVFNPRKTNLLQRTGYYDVNDGLFFEDNGVDFGIVQRSSTSGSPVDTRVSQSAWNIDKLDGTGASGITLDTTKANIYWIDLEWLGAGPTRFGIWYKNQAIICHIFENENSITVPYMKTGTLPLRTSIENTGTTATASTFKEICSAVIKEDGEAPTLGVDFSVGNGVNSIGVNSRRSILTVRPKATYNSIVNRILFSEFNFEVVATTNNVYWELVWNGTLGGTPAFTSVSANSGMEYDVAGTTVTGGITIDSGYAVSGQGSSSVASGLVNVLSKLPITLDYNGANPINLSIVCTPFTGTANVNSALSWKEVK